MDAAVVINNFFNDKIKNQLLGQFNSWQGFRFIVLFNVAVLPAFFSYDIII